MGTKESFMLAHIFKKGTRLIENAKEAEWKAKEWVHCWASKAFPILYWGFLYSIGFKVNEYIKDIPNVA